MSVSPNFLVQKFPVLNCVFTKFPNQKKNYFSVSKHHFRVLLTDNYCGVSGPPSISQKLLLPITNLKWGKVFKNRPSEICGRQPLKNLK